jgi:hypothetical protein
MPIKFTFLPVIIHSTTFINSPFIRRESPVQSARLAATIIILDFVQKENLLYLIPTSKFIL